MGGARIEEIACFQCDLSNGSGGHVLKALGGFLSHPLDI